MAKPTQEEILEYLKPFRELGKDFFDVEFPSTWEVPEGYRLEKLKVNGISIERLIPEKKKSELVIYHLHGGAYAFRYNDLYRQVALQYSQAAGGAEVVSLDYGCIPTHVFSSALEECMTVYKWMIDQGIDANNIVLAGDSAGGNLAMVLTMDLRDNHMDMPRAIFTASPWVYLGNDFDSMTRNYESDVLLGKWSPTLYEEVMHPSYVENLDIKDPYVSPLFGDFNGFPPMLIQCGDSGILFDPIVDVAKKIKEAGVDVEFSVYKEVAHDFQLFLPMLKESEKAWKEIEKFFSKVEKDKKDKK